MNLKLFDFGDDHILRGTVMWKSLKKITFTQCFRISWKMIFFLDYSNSDTVNWQRWYIYARHTFGICCLIFSLPYYLWYFRWPFSYSSVQNHLLNLICVCRFYNIKVFDTLLLGLWKSLSHWPNEKKKNRLYRLNHITAKPYNNAISPIQF